MKRCARAWVPLQQYKRQTLLFVVGGEFVFMNFEGLGVGQADTL